MVGARVTITEKNVAQQKEVVDYFSSLGIKYIWTDPLFPTVEKTPVCQDEKERQVKPLNLNTYVDNYIEAYKYAKKLGVFYGSFLACNFDGITNKHCRSCSPVPHLTPDGYIRRVTWLPLGRTRTIWTALFMGNGIPTTSTFDFDQQKVLALQNRCVENMPHCSKCRARFQCGGYCLGEVVNETGSLHGQKPSTCEAIRRLFDELGPSSTPYEYLHP